jgi:hypothetical protein
MFEKFSGFFKRFTRRQKKQSGETTIMDGKEPGLDEMGLDDSFGDMSDLEQSIDKIGTAPVDAGGAPEAGGSFSDAGFDSSDIDFSTGASDFDEQTISDEISGDRISTGYEEALPRAQEPGDFGGEFGESPFGEPGAEVQAASPKKKILTILIVAVVAIALGGVFQIFGWPYVSRMMKAGEGEQPQMDVEAELAAAKRQNAKLKAEMTEFKEIGSPAEVKNLQQQIAQARDAQGPIEELETQFKSLQEKETAYDELVQKVNEIESSIADTRIEINAVKSKIEDARQRVVALRKQTEVEYARFQNEMARAEISQRTLIELEKEYNRRFQEELKSLQEYLSRLNPEPAPSEAPQGTAASESNIAGS